MRKQKKQQKTLPVKFGLMVIGFLIFIQLIVCYFLVSLGSDYKVLEKKLNDLREENKILTESLNRQISLSKISQKAEEMGLVRTTMVLHLKEDQAVALK